jgi:hypothetical protein
MFWLVDSDQFPVCLERVNEATATDWLNRGEATAKLPASAFDLVWAKRHNVAARWYLFPHEENRPGLTIYV